MKKLFALLLAAAFTFSLAAAQDTEAPKKAKKKGTTATETTDTAKKGKAKKSKAKKAPKGTETKPPADTKQ